MDPSGSCIFEACNCYHFYIWRLEPCEKITVHNENGVNQKDILLKLFLYVIKKRINKKNTI